MPMDLRERIGAGLKEAMRDKDATRLGTLRLINAAIKDQDIAARGEGRGETVDDQAVLGILGKMVKQRQESARAYEEGGRLELAEKEREEIAIIEQFLPRQLSDDEVTAAIDAANEQIRAALAPDVADLLTPPSLVDTETVAGSIEDTDAGRLAAQ